MVSEYSIKSKAKLNLFLHIVGKRENGYHLLESLVTFTDDLYDIITISESENIELTIDGLFADRLTTYNNIILDIANIIKGNSNFGAKINLTKNIPVGAGIGGGSSNAASMIKLLTKFWNIKINEDIINNLYKLGADIACCFHSKSTYFFGIGDELQPVDKFPKLYALLINPLKSLSTKDVFDNSILKYDEHMIKYPKSFSNNKALIDFLFDKKNALLPTAIKIIPEIEEIIMFLKSQKDCMIYNMSGSGATCFGLFNTKSSLTNSYNKVKDKYNWWVSTSMLS